MATTKNADRILTAEDIWAAKDIEERTVLVPTWGGSVRIRAFSMQQVADFNRRATRRDPRTGKDEQDQNLMIALLLTEGMIEPKFTLADASRLMAKSAAAVSVIVKAINDASGLTEAAIADADKSNGTEPDAGIRVLPGTRTEDDAVGAASSDVGQ